MTSAQRRKRREEYQRNHAAPSVHFNRVRHHATPAPSVAHSTPCFKCGARGDCKHRNEPAVVFVSAELIDRRLSRTLKEAHPDALAEFNQDNAALLKKLLLEEAMPEKYPREIL
jgi:hypothetical protein